MIKVPANIQVNQIIGSLAINQPVMYVKRSKIVTVRPPLCLFFKFRFFSVFFIHITILHQKIQRKVSFLKKVLMHSKSLLNELSRTELQILTQSGPGLFDQPQPRG